MTKADFVNSAERIFLQANPNAEITGWIKKPKFITYPTGLRGLYGTFHAIAEGHRPSVMIADWDQIGGLMVR